MKNLNHIENYRDLYKNDKLYLSILNEYENFFSKNYFEIFVLYDYREENIKYFLIAKNEDLIISEYKEDKKIMETYKNFVSYYNNNEYYTYHKRVSLKYHDFNENGELEEKIKHYYIYVFDTNNNPPQEILEKMGPIFVSKITNTKSNLLYISYLNEAFRIFKHKDEFFIVNSANLIRNIKDTKNWFYDKEIQKLVHIGNERIVVLDAVTGNYEKSLDNNIEYTEYRNLILKKSEIFDF